MLNKTKQDMAVKIIEVGSDAEAILRLNEEKDRKLAALEAKFQGSIDSVIAQYDDYMKTLAPKP